MKIFINPSNLVIEGNGLKSNEITLNIGQRVASNLNAAGFTTELKQEGDIESIYSASNAWGADLFVAINCNSAGASASGTETFYFQGSANGEKLAQSIQSNIVAKLGTVDRGTKDDTQSAHGSLSVLRNTVCPAVLIELAFISNANDAQILQNRQEDFAQAISSGIMSYGGVATSAQPAQASKNNTVITPAKIFDIDFNVIAAKVRKYDDKDDIAAVNTAGDTTYGMYQFSSNKKTINAFVDWLSNHSDSSFANYGKSLAENEINSEAFIEAWKNLATVDPGNFSQLQDEFVKTNYFDKAVIELGKENFHLDKHSDELKSVIFARSYQNGVDDCVNAVKAACGKLNQPNLSYIDDKYFDNNIINAM